MGVKNVAAGGDINTRTGTMTMTARTTTRMRRRKLPILLARKKKRTKMKDKSFEHREVKLSPLRRVQPGGIGVGKEIMPIFSTQNKFYAHNFRIMCAFLKKISKFPFPNTKKYGSLVYQSTNLRHIYSF